MRIEVGRLMVSNTSTYNNIGSKEAIWSRAALVTQKLKMLYVYAQYLCGQYWFSYRNIVVLIHYCLAVE